LAQRQAPISLEDPNRTSTES